MTLSVLYRGPLSSCNYAGDYCPFAKRTESAVELAHDRECLSRFVGRVADRTGDEIGVLFTPWGEALVRKWYRDALAKLTHLPHVRKAAIQTNLSCKLDWVDDCDNQKLALPDPNPSRSPTSRPPMWMSMAGQELFDDGHADVETGPAEFGGDGGPGEGWSREPHHGRGRQPCADRRPSGRPGRDRGRRAGTASVRPFFPVRAVRRKGLRVPQFGEAAFDGALVAAENGGDPSDAAVPQLEGFGRGANPPGSFAEKRVGEAHRLGDVFREGGSHSASSRESGNLAKARQVTHRTACRKVQLRQLINSTP